MTDNDYKILEYVSEVEVDWRTEVVGYRDFLDIHVPTGIVVADKEKFEAFLKGLKDEH